MEPSELIAKAGGAVRLSKAIGHRTHSAVLKWKVIPDKYLEVIEASFGIPREEMRPDLYRGLKIVRTPTEEVRT